ncbi:unnamed protein product [Orchesella dallaii]|uniref:C2H2-type domain-containing protein n=1 Tax=Orchesella dallaii TaxID=48710 RepID=A0ABP1RBY0_9HEXA
MPIPSYDCVSCDAKFATSDLLHTHTLTHNDYECGQCDKLFNNLDDLKSHFISLHTVQGTCTVIQGLSELETNIPQTKPQPYTCEYCNKGCPNKSAYEVHVRTHTNERPYKCDYCPRAYKASHELTIHVRTHTKERPYACPEPGCDKSFTIHRSMLDHQRRHTKSFRYYCEVSGCGKGFITKQDRDRHEVRGHIPLEERPELPGEKTQCKVCNKWISQKGQMAEHMRTHTKETPFVCHICGKGFKQRNNLRVHLKSKKHTGEPMLKKGRRGKKSKQKAQDSSDSDYDPDDDQEEEQDEQEDDQNQVVDVKPTPSQTAQAQQPLPSTSFATAHFPMYVPVNTKLHHQPTQQSYHSSASLGVPQFTQFVSHPQMQINNIPAPVLTLHDPFHSFQ